MIWTLFKMLVLALIAFLIFGEIKHVKQIERLMKHGLPKIKIILKNGRWTKGGGKKP